MVRLGDSRYQATSVSYRLKEADWLDQYTSALSVEFTVFSTDVSLATIVTVLFEFPIYGGVLKSWHFHSMRLHKLRSGPTNAALGFFRLSYVWFTVYLCVRVGRALRRLKYKRFFKETDNLLDFLACAFSLSSIVVAAVNTLYSSYVMERFRSGEDTQAAMELIAEWQHGLTFFLSLMVVVVTLKFLVLLRFNRSFHRLMLVLNYILPFIAMAIFILSLLCIMFGTVLYVISAGALYNYHSMTHTWFVLVAAVLRSVNFTEWEEVNNLLGPVVLLLCCVAVYIIMLNVMSAVLIDTLFIFAKKPKPREEMRLLKLILIKVLHLSGINRQLNKIGTFLQKKLRLKKQPNVGIF